MVARPVRASRDMILRRVSSTSAREHDLRGFYLLLLLFFAKRTRVVHSIDIYFDCFATVDRQQNARKSDQPFSSSALPTVHEHAGQIYTWKTEKKTLKLVRFYVCVRLVRQIRRLSRTRAFNTETDRAAWPWRVYTPTWLPTMTTTSTWSSSCGRGRKEVVNDEKRKSKRFSDHDETIS